MHGFILNYERYHRTLTGTNDKNEKRGQFGHTPKMALKIKMETLETKTKICVQKVMSNDKDSTTYQQVKKGHRLYNCIECSGSPGSCPDYVSYNYLVNKHGVRE